MPARLVRAHDLLINAMALLAAVALVLMSLWVTYEVIMRYSFNSPTIWAVDLSEYTMLYSTFLAAPWLVRQGGHTKIEALLEHLTPRQQNILGVLSAIVAAGVAAVMLWQGFEATLDAYARGQMIARSWQVPRALVWACIPLGSFFLVIEFLRAAVRSARAVRSDGVAVPRTAGESVV